jgi:DNA polymerase
MPSKDSASRILDDARKFLKAQREVYGNFAIEKTTAAPSEKKPGKPSPTQNVQPAGDIDLFGNSPHIVRATMPASVMSSKPLPADEPWCNAGSLPDLDRMINTCMKCTLGSTRTKFVFGVGNPHTDVMLVGEAPGADEDAQGEPFVGRAGQLLNKILEAIHFKREDVYICNILKCRPPNNREPLPEEMAMCTPYLHKQMDIIKPKLILCLGRISAQTLLNTKETLTKLRGQVHSYRGAKLMATFHPAALLRNPNWKIPTWEDVKMFRTLYDEMKSQH